MCPTPIAPATVPTRQAATPAAAPAWVDLRSFGATTRVVAEPATALGPQGGWASLDQARSALTTLTAGVAPGALLVRDGDRFRAFAATATVIRDFRPPETPAPLAIEDRPATFSVIEGSDDFAGLVDGARWISPSDTLGSVEIVPGTSRPLPPA